MRACATIARSAWRSPGWSWPPRPQPGMNRPNVSVVVPVADGGAPFAACLAALGELTPAPVEIIVVADGSTDESADRALAAGAAAIWMAQRSGSAAARDPARGW